MGLLEIKESLGYDSSTCLIYLHQLKPEELQKRLLDRAARQFVKLQRVQLHTEICACSGNGGDCVRIADVVITLPVSQWTEMGCPKSLEEFFKACIPRKD